MLASRITTSIGQDMQPSDFHARIFLESHCNFRCVYCNPDAERQEGKIIPDEEIMSFLKTISEAGIKTIHYSGGEPTLRKSLPFLMAYASKCGIERQSMTTNAATLARNIDDYVKAGLKSVNISIDSLNTDKFASMTGRDDLPKVLEAIERALERFEFVKLNVVILDTNIDEVEDFMKLSARKSGRLIVRLIELQTNQPIFFQAHRISKNHVPATEIYERIMRFGQYYPIDFRGKNPNCHYYKYVSSDVIFGVIANHSRGYPCGDCKKLRLSPFGDLGVCIGAEGTNIRNLGPGELKQAVLDQIEARRKLDIEKPERKHLSKDYGFWRWGDLNPDNTARPIPIDDGDNEKI